MKCHSSVCLFSFTLSSLIHQHGIVSFTSSENNHVKNNTGSSISIADISNLDNGPSLGPLKIQCLDICWNGLNCHLEQCQDCPFACPSPQTFDENNNNNNNNNTADKAHSEPLQPGQSANGRSYAAKFLPPQCTTIHTETCSHKCLYRKHCSQDNCSSCAFCENAKSIPTSSSSSSSSSNKKCKLQTTFKDHTKTILFKTTPHFFSRYLHSGKPYFHEGPPTFFHMDSDGNLDYFNSMHGHPLFDEWQLERRLELALSSSSLEYDTTSTSNSSSSFASPSSSKSKEFSLRQISNHIIIEDSLPDLVQVDLHGAIIADLDHDGYNDIYVANGGNRGEELKYPEIYDNLLFWGEPSPTLIDSITGLPLTLFRGGRQTAVNANVHMRNSRGRFTTLIDVNNDGLLDLFVSQDRKISNAIVPGVLLMNNGDRTFREDTSMQEYTRALLITDADGDGVANEIVLNRSFCFPQRDGPGVDPLYPDLGKFTTDMKQFCSTRPVGTTAVYKYNDQLGLEDIAKPYYNFNGLEYQQPTCCPHTSYDEANNCHAISIVSDDFDYDELADHLYLYKYKMEFYFSTDRPVDDDGGGRDILETPVVGNPNYIGLKIDFPSHCGAAVTVSIIDLDNNGHDEIFVTCENAGVFLIYTRDESQMFIGDSASISGSYKRSWTLENGCNQESGGKNPNPLGQINDRFLAAPTKGDLNELCQDEERYLSQWNSAKRLCNKFMNKGKEIPAAIASGVSIIDFNNDGFLDVVISHNFGYLRFFYNEPKGTTASNRFISFSLSDEASYGIGTTLVLYCAERESGRIITQFHEISSYHHGSSKHSTQDDKIIFGLGKNLHPEKLLIRWPTDKYSSNQMKEVDLRSWTFSGDTDNGANGDDGHDDDNNEPIVIVMDTNSPSEIPSNYASSRPSFFHSQTPTSIPTLHPSSRPSSAPSTRQSDQPTIMISNIPSTSPSVTSSPTDSQRPSFLPSETMSPSHVPSSASQIPSMMPSLFQKKRRPKGGVGDFIDSAGSTWRCFLNYRILLFGVAVIMVV